MSVHRHRLLEQEQKICQLEMEKRDAHDLNAMKDREIQTQAQRILELEQLLREQYLLLKVNGLVSEQHSRQYTTTTGEILLTPRRSPSLGSQRLGHLLLSQRSRSPIPLSLPLFDADAAAACVPPQPTQTDLSIMDDNENTLGESFPVSQPGRPPSPYHSPHRPRSILKKDALLFPGSVRKKKSVKIVSPPQAQPAIDSQHPKTLPLQKSPWPAVKSYDDSLCAVAAPADIKVASTLPLVECEDARRQSTDGRSLAKRRKRGTTLPVPQTPTNPTPSSSRSRTISRLMAPTVASSNRKLEKWRSTDLTVLDLQRPKNVPTEATRRLSGKLGGPALALSDGKENAPTTKRRKDLVDRHPPKVTDLLGRKPSRVVLDVSFPQTY